MLILIEGADGAGKSHLAERLRLALEASHPGDVVELRREGPPIAHPIDQYATPLYGYRPGTGHHIIFDRHFVGEWVYPAVLARSTDADLPTWRWLNMFLATRGALVVHANPPVTQLEDNVRRRGDDVIEPHQLADIAHRFTLQLKQTSLSVYPYERLDDPLAVSKIVTRARDLEARAWELGSFVTYVGPPRPRYLLLGDVRRPMTNLIQPETPPESTRYYGPAFGPYRATSGHYLLASLPQHMLDAGVGLANACDVDDPLRLHATLNYPRAVALGANAWRRLRGRFLLGAAPHPQYARRFHHAHGTAYGEVIAAAAEHGRSDLSWRP